MVPTCARPSEALRARWSHIDLRKRLWTIPAGHMKSLREHIAPLNEIAVATLGRRLKLRGERPASDFVFTGPSGAPLGYTNFALAPKRAGINAGSPHSLAKSFFPTGAATRLSFRASWPNFSSPMWCPAPPATISARPRPADASS